MVETNTVTQLYTELPIFANKENQDLHAEITAKTTELKQCQTDCSDLQERVNVLQEHFKEVQAQLSKSQKHYTEKLKLAEESKHLQQLCLREKGKIETELAKTNSQIDTVLGLKENVNNQIRISQTRIEQFKSEMNYNQQELDQWMVIARQKEEDHLVLQRYTKEDEVRIRSMILEIEKHTGILEAKKERT